MGTKTSCPVFESFLASAVPDLEMREKLAKELRNWIEDIVTRQLRREMPGPSLLRQQSDGPRQD
jgi:hypothetical protein